MSILFKKIEALFPPQNAFQPQKDLWVYSYRLPEPFGPDTVSQSSQVIEFRARAESEEGENVSRLEIEFRLSAQNLCLLLEKTGSMARELGGELKGLSYYMYKPWPGREKPFWLKSLASISEYMVWEVEMDENESDIEGLAKNVAAEGDFFSGILEVAFSVDEAVSIAESATPRGGEAAGSRKSVMLVDDNEATLNLLQIILRTDFLEEELSFIPCNSGVKAFDMALETKPDMIILDLMMPGKSGFEVLEELKKHPETEDIPVVILSVIYDEESISTAERLGVTRYLAKPFVPFDITQVIRELLFDKTAKDR